MRPLRSVVVVVITALVVAVGIRLLANATMSRHEQVAPGSEIELVVDAQTHDAEAGQTLREMVTAQILECRFQVSSDLVGGVVPVTETGSHGRYRAVLTPSLDRTDRRQFSGRLEDWRIDHVRLHVVRLAQIPPAPPPAPPLPSASR